VLPEATDEIQYLDLCLDSDNSSPRTPNMDIVNSKSASMGNHRDAIPLKSPSPTVYKTLDFVKIEALKNLKEENHREKPQ
jgi:hypothetical protein